MDAPVIKWTMCCVFVPLQRAQLKQSAAALIPQSLLYVELPALDDPSVWKAGQRLADSPELLLPLL